ncbi:MAG: ornithine cyclodeaminase family protein [Cyclobacteriaceae bacterium]|nr:ornithine cyclodeaminase family protein [Cyclobacteriaceae bacterium]
MADARTIEEALSFNKLINALKQAFADAFITTPARHHHDYLNPGENIDSSLLLMPSWKSGSHLGVKLVTVSPNNYKYKLPSIQGLYILFDAVKGTPLMLLDAQELTARRTASSSALASTFLSRIDSETLLMVGTGKLAPYLIEAHATVRRYKRILIWGRNRDKAQAVCDVLNPKMDVQITRVEDLEKGIKQADVVSCATLSATPLILGTWLKPGQHIDLVGAYKSDMREADDALMLKSKLYVDTPMALKETGDLLIPMTKGILDSNDIRGDLFQLCQKTRKGREKKEEITVFKSVGNALEDYVAAKMVHDAHCYNANY